VFEKPCQTRTPTSALILLVVLVKIGRGGADVLHYSVHLLCPCRAGVQQLSEDAEQPSRLRGRTEQVKRQATHRVSAASSRVLLAVVFRCRCFCVSGCVYVSTPVYNVCFSEADIVAAAA
jgi:hypothetical protein